MSLTQRKWVEEQLRLNGEISRNQCLRKIPAITRLSAYMLDLKHAGWKFTPEEREGDYVYKLDSQPAIKPREVHYVRHPLTGERITTEQLSLL